MSFDTIRRRLWNRLGLNSTEMETVFMDAQKAASGRQIEVTEQNTWLEKTRNLIKVFNYFKIPFSENQTQEIDSNITNLAGYSALWDIVSKHYPGIVDPPKGISKEELTEALRQLGQAALEQNTQIEMVAVGGAAMVLVYEARQATHDLDAVIISPKDHYMVNKLADQVASDIGWQGKWLEEAGAYYREVTPGDIIFTAPGIVIRVPKAEQLLAMKLSAWRDELDISDARLLLQKVSGSKNIDVVWNEIESYFIIPGGTKKARRAFEELWKEMYGNN